ncbi:MAG: hypothetical protein ACKPEY_19895, partial [Planctomycetota bacterium]
SVSPRVSRGGSWRADAWYCRAAIRNRGVPERRHFDLGFRLARSSVQSSPAQARLKAGPESE